MYFVTITLSDETLAIFLVQIKPEGWSEDFYRCLKVAYIFLSCFYTYRENSFSLEIEHWWL